MLFKIFQFILVMIKVEKCYSKKDYSNGLALIAYLDIYGEKIELTISYPGQNITTFSSRIERIEIKSNVIHYIHLDKCVAELQIEPHLFLKVLSY